MQQAAVAKRPPAEVFFDGTHCETKNRVTVKRFTDRATKDDESSKHLIVIYNQERNICAIRVGRFRKSLEEEGDGPEQESRAAAFMVELAQQYCEDKVNASNIKTIREESLEKLNLTEKFIRPNQLKRATDPVKKDARRYVVIGVFLHRICCRVTIYCNDSD